MTIFWCMGMDGLVAAVGIHEEMRQSFLIEIAARVTCAFSRPMAQ